jgi:uncharacterized protein YuzE
MKVKYFPETDTALVEFLNHEVAETKEISENIYIDLDVSGNLVAMTVEHARQQASLPDLSYEQIENQVPNQPFCSLLSPDLSG